ncbi:MAG: fibronectin type III domain-containing protein [Gemmatimonadota bacterium]
MNTHSPWRDPGLKRIARALGSILLVSLLGAAPARAQPSNLTVTGVTASQIDLAWTGVVFATYNVYRDGTQIASGLGSPSYSDAPLSAFTEYDYYVTATVFGTESGPSNTVTQRTLDDSPPSIPAGLVATAVSTTQIDLVWNPSTDGETGISEYVVYRDGFPVGRSTSTSYSDTGLTASTVYQYRISAINGQGLESGQSGPQNEKTLDPEPPTPPTNLSASTVSASEIDLTWTASTAGDVTGYRVLRNGTSVAVLGTTTSYRDSGLQGFTTYNYTVTALDSEGLESGPSAPAQATTLDATPPTTPSNLAATATGTTTIGLTWAASADPETGVASYLVFRNGSEIGSTSQTTYQDTGLSPSTTYKYRVRAVNGDGLESSLSNEASATTRDGSGPSTPTNLAATPAGTDRIDLTWTASSDPESGIAYYLVYRDGSQVGQTSQTSFNDTGLSPATRYVYRVLAVNGDGLESGLSSQAAATTLDATEPSTPTNLVATPADTDRIDLTWTASSDPESGIAGYRIFRDGSQVGQTAQSSYTDTGLSPATEYEYRVRAVNGDGLQSGLSDPAKATTLDATPPTTPQNLAAAPVGTERIDLTWDASQDPESGVAEYRVFRDGSEVGTTTQTVFQADGLSPATEYSFYVVAVNGDGLDSEPSATVNSTTFDGTGPTTPTLLTATALGTDRIDLEWAPSEDPESGIASYKVFRDGSEVATTTETAYQDTGLDPATTYEYRVSATNGDGLQGGLSDPAQATTLDGSGPSAPANVAAETVSQTQINLTWTASEDPESGVDRYIVYRDNTMIGSVTDTSFADSGLTQNTTYVYSISAVNGEEIEGDRSDDVSAKTFPSEDTIPPAPPTQLRVVQ